MNLPLQPDRDSKAAKARRQAEALRTQGGDS